METLIKPEIYLPIVLNLLLAAITFAYLMETRTMRKDMGRQLDFSKRQHFVSTAPFLYADSIILDSTSDEFTFKIINPSEKLARDVKYIIFDSAKKTFRSRDSQFVVIKPGNFASATLGTAPFTKMEVEKKLKSFYDIKSIEEPILSEGNISYALIFYTDVEGSVYSVKAFLNAKKDAEDGSYTRQRSRFKKVYDPRD